MTGAEIEDVFDGLLYDLHRLKYSDHGIDDLRHAITEIELARSRLVDAAERGASLDRLIATAIRAVESLQSSVEERDAGERWVRDRISMVRMGIDRVLDELSSRS